MKNWIRAHVELTDWINANLAEAKKLLNEQIQRGDEESAASGRAGRGFLADCSSTYDPLHTALDAAAQQAFDDGFSGKAMPDLSGLYDLTLLNEVLAEQKRKALQ